MRAVFVMVKTDPGHGTEVANRVAEVPSFSEAYSITGQYDLLVKLYIEDVDGLGRLIERDIHSIPHIRDTFTILTFEAFGDALNAAHVAAMQESAPSIGTILSHFSLDIPWLLLILPAAIIYTVAARRAFAQQRIHRHARWKLAALLGGLVVLALGVMSPIEYYGNQLLWVDFLGFLLITMIAPPLIVLSSPLTLAFRVSGPIGRRRLRRFYRSGPVRLITFPVASGLIFAAVTYLWQFSSLTDVAARHTAVREIQEFSLFVVALIFWTPALCADPVRWRTAYPLRGLYVFVETTHKALFGAMFLALDRPVHTAMASRMPAYGPDAITDQRLAIVILWIGGNLIFLVTLVGLIKRWVEYEARNAHRVDRRLAKEREAARSRQAALDKVFGRGV